MHIFLSESIEEYHLQYYPKLLPNDVKVMTTQTLENLFSFICGSHVGGKLSALQSIFPYNSIKNV